MSESMVSAAAIAMTGLSHGLKNIPNLSLIDADIRTCVQNPIGDVP